VPADVEAAVMVPPIHLGDLAQLIFRDLAQLLAAQGRAKADYAQHVALLAMRLEQVQRFQAVLEVEGDTYTTTTGMIKARPQVAMLSDSMRQAQSLIAELMLNPSAAMRATGGGKPEAGAFDDFFK
jgi:P27 family predicted phage terminase small subunit